MNHFTPRLSAGAARHRCVSALFAVALIIAVTMSLAIVLQV